MQHRQNIFAACAVSLAILTTGGFAQAQSVPGSADAGRQEQRIQDELPPVGGAAVLDVPDYMITSAPPGAENQMLVLQGITLDGVTAYSQDELSPLYEDLIGQEISLAEVFGIAERLTVKYRNDGYILSQVIVPPQEIDNGRVRLEVIEGYIDGLTIEGDLSDSEYSRIENMAVKIVESPPLNIQELERYLLLMNDLSGMTIRSVLSPSETQPGAADITLFVEKDSAEFLTQLDNRGSRYLGQVQLSAAARFNSLFGRGEALDMQVVTAPDGHPSRELDYIGLNYTETINSEGTRLNIGANYTETEPGYTLSDFDVEGRAKGFHIGLTHPVIRSRSQNLFIFGRFDALNVTRSDNFTVGKTEDRIRAVRLGGTYQFTDRLIGINTIEMTLSQGLDILNARESDSDNLTRARGRHDFTKFEAEVSRLQHVSNKVNLLGAVKGQKTNHILLSSEEFGVGGSDYGRAYDNSEIVGEDGIAAKLELQINDPVKAPYIDGYQLYGYYDIGKVWDRDNPTVRDQERSLASVGAGVRFDFTETISGSAELALPMTRDVQTQGDQDPRGFFSLTAAF
jgi:hemolysin activation/secretion protein